MAVVVGDVREIDGELQNAVHRAAASIDQLFYVLHHFGDVAVDVILAYRAIGVRALSGDVNQSVVSDERR